MNPYTSRILGMLGDRPAVAVLEATPKRLQELFAALGAKGLKRSYAPGKWTAAQILCHLADVEVVLAFRLRQALAEPNHRIQVFEQDDWAKRYSELDPATALATQNVVREWNLALIRRLTPEDLRRVTHHPERGEESVDTIIKLLAGHDLNHMQQLEQIRAAAAGA
jgi:hypothetical protein